jgi:nucleoside-diphosphate-sugar epimerase
LRVFIAGLTGFIGELLAPELVSRGHEVSGLVRYVSTRDRETVERMLPGVAIHFGDMLDMDSLKAALKEARPDVVLNLAAQTSVEYSFRHLLEIYHIDFVGTVNLSLAAMATVTDLQKFIQASSVETYGNQERLPLREDMKLNPAAPYGVAKAAGEYHLNYLHQAFGFPSVIVRSANTYGRRRNKNFVVEHIIHCLLERQGDVKMGIPTSRRDFLYIDDERDFYIGLIESQAPPAGEIINTGTGDPVSIAELFDKLVEIVGFRPGKISWNSISPRPNEIRTLTMDISKAKRLLDWEPKIGLDEGLRRTVQYWREVWNSPRLVSS